MWSACGVMAGFSQGGGVGLALANWMIHGDPGFDVFAMDVARYGDWATLAYTNAKVQENYSPPLLDPVPERGTARRAAAENHADLRPAEGAGRAVRRVWGLEQPLWFAPEGVVDEFSWRRSTDFEHVGEEAKNVRDRTLGS